MSGCGYTGYHFGAPYPDAKCDGGSLLNLNRRVETAPDSGCREPCPACRTAEALAFHLEKVFNTASPDCNQIEQLEHVILVLHTIAPKALGKALAEIDLPVFHHFKRGKCVESRRWPWRVKDLTAHENAALRCPPKER